MGLIPGRQRVRLALLQGLQGKELGWGWGSRITSHQSRITKSRLDPIPLLASPLKGEESGSSLPFKGERACGWIMRMA